MSVADRNFEPMKEVSTMTASTFGTTSNTASIARRPIVDVTVERIARGLLAWSDRRAQNNRILHERMALLLENQRSTERGGSQLGR
jgi:hypothetical protein